MGKNSRNDRIQDQIQSDIDRSRSSADSRNKRYQDYVDTALDRSAGFDADVYSKYNKAYGDFGDVYGAYSDIAESGLGDEYSKARGFYGDLMKTGGFSDKDSAMFRERATAPTRGFWDSYKREMDSANAINPYNVGRGAQSSSAARKAGQSISEAGLNAETDLQGMIRQGRLAGAGGEERIAGNINSNRLAGRSGQINALQGQMGATSGIDRISERQLNFALSQIDNILASEQLDANTRSQLLQLKAQMNPRVSGWERAMQVYKIVAEASASAATMGA